MKEIKISEILDDLNRGLSRSPKSPGYNPEVGSVQEKYSLTNKETTYLFKHPQLKGVRKGDPVMINIIDDTPSKVEDTIVNNSGLEPEDFDNPWEDEIKKAKEIARAAVSENQQ